MAKNKQTNKNHEKTEEQAVEGAVVAGTWRLKMKQAEDIQADFLPR